MENPIILESAQCVYNKLMVGCVEGILPQSLLMNGNFNLLNTRALQVYFLY